MKTLLILISLYALAYVDSHAAEKDYVNKHCKGQILTYKGSPRINCLTDTHAIDFVTKSSYKAGIFNAKWAAKAFNRKPGIVVIVEDGDTTYYDQLKQVDSMDIWMVTPTSTQTWPPLVSEIRWDIPTKRAQGQVLPIGEISHYCVYISDNPEWIGRCIPTKETSYPKPEGPVFVRVSTVDTNGEEADVSDALVIR